MSQILILVYIVYFMISSVINTAAFQYKGFIAYANSNVMMNLIVVAVFVLLAVGWYKKCFIRFKNNINKCLIWIFVIAFGLLGIELLIGYIFSITNIVQETSTNQDSLNLLYSKAPIQMFINTVLAAPFIEETVFRGGIYRGLRKYHFSVPLAAIITGLIFGSMHMISTIGTTNYAMYLWIIPYAITGTLLCLPYEFTGSIYTSMGSHVLLNVFSLISKFIEGVL